MNPLLVQKMRGCRTEWDEMMKVGTRATFTLVRAGWWWSKVSSLAINFRRVIPPSAFAGSFSRGKAPTCVAHGRTVDRRHEQSAQPSDKLRKEIMMHGCLEGIYHIYDKATKYMEHQARLQLVEFYLRGRRRHRYVVPEESTVHTVRLLLDSHGELLERRGVESALAKHPREFTREGLLMRVAGEERNRLAALAATTYGRTLSWM